MQGAEIRVWDPFVRVCHWLLATIVLVDWFTDEPRWMHVWLGYIGGALVLLRAAWGFVGSENARFRKLHSRSTFGFGLPSWSRTFLVAALPRA